MTQRTDTARPARRGLTWALVALALVVSLGLSYGAYTLAGYSWDQVVSYESPYTAMSGSDFSGIRPELSSPIPGAEPRRVAIVLIDGLRDDASRTMASIEDLRSRGADVRLTVPQPSLSYPTWTTIMTGAPQQISGVTTNWFEGPVKVETLLEVASGSGRRVIVTGPDGLDEMFSASEVADASTIVEWEYGTYMSGTIVDAALAHDAEEPGDFIFVLLPDVDNVGHESGGASSEYAEVVGQVDDDLGRLIAGLDDGATTFFVLPDHGHIDTGGHGGWEEPVIRTFLAAAGPGIRETTAEAHLMDVAPTVAVVAGMQAPMQALGTAIDEVLADENGRSRDAEFIRAAGLTLSYVRKVSGESALTQMDSIASPDVLPGIRAEADDARLAEERAGRVWWLLGAVAFLLGLMLVIAWLSWRALVAAIAGTAVFAALYNALFFGLHGYRWSLSAFNDETMIQAFFNGRMVEAALAALVGCIVAALLYAALRGSDLKGPRHGYTSGWLALGSATVLLIQAVLLVQVAIFVWRWSPSVTWILPDMREAFKYDLDLIQMTAIGAAAVLGPLATYLVGRIKGRGVAIPATVESGTPTAVGSGDLA
jgi:hypothetical protein